MVSKKVKVLNPNGLHLKPAGYLCNIALEYKSNITLHAGEKYVNAKSVLGVLSACIKSGNEVEIICTGEDEEEALAAVEMCFKRGLGGD